MNIFSFIWTLLIVVLTISNIHYIFRYFLDKYLLKSSQKINTSFILIQSSFLYIAFFSNIINDLFIKDNSSELVEILSLNRIEPFIIFAFLVSIVLILCFYFFDYSATYRLKFLNIIIVFILIFYPFFEAIQILRAILFGGLLLSSAMPFSNKIFFIYRRVLPCIYLVSYLLFLFISERKTHSKNDYNKKLKTSHKLKNSLLFFYLMFVIGIVYLKIKGLDLFIYRSPDFLIEIAHNSFIFIAVYAGISYYISNKDNKAELLNNLLKKIFILNACFPTILLIGILVYHELQKVEINIIVTITAAVLTTVVTYVTNVFINRYFNPKH